MSFVAETETNSYHSKVFLSSIEKILQEMCKVSVFKLRGDQKLCCLASEKKKRSTVHENNIHFVDTWHSIERTNK